MSLSWLRLALAVVMFSGLLPPPAAGQAPPNLALARVRYNSLKTSARPDGALKVQIDEIDRQIAEATRFGRTGELRRLLAKGTTLLSGRDWTDLDDFSQSLVLRTDQLFIDAAAAYRVRLEQIYAPSLALTAPLTVRALVRPLLSQPAGLPEVYEVGSFTGVSRDLRESPLAMDLDLSAAFNGPHTLEVEVHDEARQIGRVALRVWVQKGMTERLAALEAAAKTLPAGPRASVRYPADYISKVNRGLVEMGTFDLGRELNAAEAVASAASRAVDPFAERRGDFKRHHLLPSAGEILPYRVYVPKAYDGTRAAPLVVALHGLGATEDSFFDAYGRNLPRLAEERGYLVVAPLGYRVDGFYGSGIGATIDPAAERTRQLSEQDVMAVLMRMREDYKVDDRRVYLLGHSMGAIGAWHLAAKYPERWAAVAAFAGTGPPASVARMKDIPQFVVHGDADPTVSVSGSRGMVAEMRKLGVDVRYIEVPGGNHIDVVVPHLDGAFDFFDTHAKGTPATRR